MKKAAVAEPSMPIERHYRPVTIGQQLGVSAKTIHRLMDRGALRYALIGQRRVVPESALRAYVESRSVGRKATS